MIAVLTALPDRFVVCVLDSRLGPLGITRAARDILCVLNSSNGHEYCVVKQYKVDEDG